ncbi:hypothetical protein Syun_005099 [Stephania yunnanensis]|uniref:Cytochrome P450 n=1 Tax=Stephania yunnanensis TaxID=152371 RepID=A0AAP0Q1E9_9MAGN
MKKKKKKFVFQAMLMSLEEPNELEMLRKDVAQVFQAMLAFPINLPWTTFRKGLKESTANAITWMVKYLDENQDVQETLRDEQLKIKETSRASSLTVDDLNKMSYASKVVKESLRMASIVPWFPRVALEDCELEGFKSRKGWVINIDAKAMHLDPSVYQDPTRFHPPRFHMGKHGLGSNFGKEGTFLKIEKRMPSSSSSLSNFFY